MSENPFDGLVDDDDLDDEGTSGENSSFAEVRKAYNRSERKAKALEKELAELREFKETVVKAQRESALTAAFMEAGLSPKHAALFEKASPDAEITVDTVRAFAEEFELPVNPPQTDQDPPKSSGFVPVTTTGNPPNVEMLDADAISRLRLQGAEGWAAIKKAKEQGRIVEEEVPWTPAGAFGG